MNGPDRTEALWRQLADEQDRALEDRRPLEALALRFTPPERRPPARTRRFVALGLTAAVAVAGAFLLVRAPALRFQIDPVTDGDVGKPLRAQAHSDLPVTFSDGSRVTFRPGAEGRVQRLSHAGAEVELERGRLEASVVHRERTRWRVQAGPFAVRVTGTRFTVDWQPGPQTLQVVLHEGSVVVEGAVLGTGVPLRAGQRMTVDARAGLVRTDEGGADTAPTAAPPPEPATAAAPPAPETAAAPPAPGSRGRARPATAASDEPEAPWLTLARTGAYAEALAAAERAGYGALCRRLSADRLLELGDVARYARHPARAEQAYASLVDRFPRDPTAADALFLLGRLALDGGRHARAATLFERYTAEWADAPMAADALGLLAQAAARAGRADVAAMAARRYLQGHPAGPHAPAARGVLAGTPP